jgi:Fur family ferric uptake transcriptional regulator
MIWEVLAADPDLHLSADELVERVHRELPGMNASTVYRTLEMLVEEGLVRRTYLGGDRTYFEPASEHAHHHLVCTSCGAVLHFHDATLGDLPERVRADHGFELADAELTLFGLCSTCQAPTEY